MVTFDTMTVGEFQALYAVQKSDMDPLDKITESIAILASKTHREVEEMPVLEYKKMETEVVNIWDRTRLVKQDVSKTLRCGDKVYGLCYIPAKLSAGQYIEVQTWMSGDVIENMHMILASISYPVINGKEGKNDPSLHAEVAADFQKALFKEAHASCLFFCQLFGASIRGLANYLEKVIRSRKMTNPDRRKALTNLRAALAGFSLLSRSRTTII